ncbi:MAG: YihY/virulence factor BrkB family protein [Vicinamibacterales bacterium]
MSQPNSHWAGPALRRIARAAAAEVRTTAVLSARAFWRGSIEFYNSDDLTYAASVSYYALLSLFPFFLIVFAILGGVTADETDRAAVVGFLFKYFPTRFGFLTQQLDALRETPARLGIGGALALVWAALGVFGALTSAVDHAWGVEKQRSYLRHKLFSFLMLAAAGVLMLAALLLVSAVQVAQANWFTGVMERYPALEMLSSFGARWGSTLLLMVVFGLIFYFVPNAQVRFRDVWIGALVTALLWRGALAGFSWYLRTSMRQYTAIHGSVAAVVVFLFWVYVSCVILLFGVEMTAAYARLRRRRPEDLPAAPAPRQ